VKLGRYVPHISERQSFTEVLDYFIKWSATRQSAIQHYDKEHNPAAVSFARTSDSAVFWTAYPRVDEGAKFEILPRRYASLSPELREDAQSVLCAIGHWDPNEASSMRLPFLALKRPATRDRVTELLDRLLAGANARQPVASA
jgi:hypothetical protein